MLALQASVQPRRPASLADPAIQQAASDTAPSALHLRCVAEFSRIRSRRRRCAAPRPALPAPGSALRRPARRARAVPSPGGTSDHISSSSTPAGTARSHLPRLPLSSSRRPSQDPFGVAGAIRLHRARTRNPLPSDLAPAREMDGTRTLAAPQADGEPVTPIQAQDQGVMSLVEKHPSEPCARPEHMRR